MHRFLTSLLLLFALHLSAQELTPGKVVPSVKCSAAPDQSYALYLPSNYDAKRAWPALFMFDPAARGSVAVESARQAAEAHGVIVIASNNSKNGSMKNSVEAGRAMWNDAHQRLKIDPKRTYAAGFSGGARVAIIFAKMCGDCISSVIASGAGYPNIAGPSKDDKFALFLSAGDLDFNYKEVVLLRDQLDKLGLRYRSYVFHGPHQWTDTAGWNQAFDWIALQEMKSGILLKDKQQIASLLNSFNEYAQRLKSEGDLVNAVRSYESNISDFSGLADLSSTIAARDAIRSDAALAQQTRAEKSALTDQTALESDTLRDFAGLTKGGEEHAEALRNIRARMASVRKKIDKTRDHEPIIERRTLSGLFASCIETAEPLMRQGHYELALELYTAVIDFAKSAPGAHLGKARALAKMGKHKDALAETKLALDRGVPPEAVRSSPELASLLEKPEWRSLLSD